MRSKNQGLGRQRRGRPPADADFPKRVIHVKCDFHSFGASGLTSFGDISPHFVNTELMTCLRSSGRGSVADRGFQRAELAFEHAGVEEFFKRRIVRLADFSASCRAIPAGLAAVVRYCPSRRACRIWSRPRSCRSTGRTVSARPPMALQSP